MVNRSSPMLRRTLFLGGLLLAAACGPGPPGPPPSAPRASGDPQPGHLIPLLTLHNPRLPETAGLIAAVGNVPEKAAAGRQPTRSLGDAGRRSRCGYASDDAVRPDRLTTPPSMMQCLYGVVKQAQFAPPRGGDARVSIPLTFTQG